MSAIARVYRLTKKTPDQPWNTYVCRPIAAALVHALRDSRVTPDQITLVSLVVAVAAAAAFIGLPGHWGLGVAVVVYEASYVLDCADGMLARLRGTQSAVGHLLDFLMDEIKAFCILGAVAIRLYLDREAPLFLMIGIGGLVALAAGVGLTTFVRRPEVAGAGRAGAEPASSRSLIGRLVSGVETVAKFLIHYPSYIWVAAAIGRLEVYLYPYVAVTAVYAARTLLQVALRFGRA